MLPKIGVTPAGYYEYTVFPPEGLWDIEPSLERARQNGGALDKSALRWSIMIRQPDFVTPELLEDVRAMALRKKDPARVDLCRLETITDGLSVQMMHIGPYDAEPASFARMDEFCCKHGYVRRGYLHREIYLSDPPARRPRPAAHRDPLRCYPAGASTQRHQG